MKVSGHLGLDMRKIPENIKVLEDMGFDSAGSAEMNHDPFFPLLLAAEHSEKIELHTGIAVAFARSPMILANLGHDLTLIPGGVSHSGLVPRSEPMLPSVLVCPGEHLQHRCVSWFLPCTPSGITGMKVKRWSSPVSIIPTH